MVYGVCSSQVEVSQHVVSQQPGARVLSDFASFPSTSFVKVRASAHTHTHTHTVCSSVSVFRSNPADVCVSGQSGAAERLGAGGEGDDSLRSRRGADALPRPVAAAAAARASPAHDVNTPPPTNPRSQETSCAEDTVQSSSCSSSGLQRLNTAFIFLTKKVQ